MLEIIGRQKMDNDLESNNTFLLNETVHSLSWRDITVSVNDRDLIKGISGDVQAGMPHKPR